MFRASFTRSVIYRAQIEVGNYFPETASLIVRGRYS